MSNKKENKYSKHKLNKIRKRLMRLLQEDYYFKRCILTTELKKLLEDGSAVGKNNLYAALYVGEYKISSLIIHNNKGNSLLFEVAVNDMFSNKGWVVIDSFNTSQKHDYKNFEKELFKLLWDSLTERVWSFKSNSFKELTNDLNQQALAPCSPCVGFCSNG